MHERRSNLTLALTLTVPLSLNLSLTLSLTLSCNPIPNPNPEMLTPHPNQVALARRLRPRRTLLVGMGHAMEHHATNRRLRRLWTEEGLDIQLAYDGQFVPLEF